MSSAAFYYKLNKKMNENLPIGSLVPMIDDLNSNIYKPSGDVISTIEYPLFPATSNLLQAIETTNFSLTGQVPFTHIACSPTLILAVGQNSKIYTSPNGETWTSYDCPAASGVFTNIFVEYAPAPISKFYITDRVGSTYSGTDTVYTSVDGVSWSSYSGGNYYSNPQGFGFTSYPLALTKYNPSAARWERFNLMFAWSDPGGGIVTHYYTSISYKSDITSSSDWIASSWIDWGISSSQWINNYYTISSSIAQTCSSLDVYSYYPFHCVNGLYQPKIFCKTGTVSALGVVTPYASSFVFPNHDNMIMVYDIANNRYMAINKLTNQYYLSAAGTTWSAAVSIGAGSYSINAVGIRHNQSRFVALGNVVKTSDNNGGTWSAQTMLSLGGNFTKIAVSPTGVSVVSSLNSSVVARATNGVGFDLTTITDSANWQNVFWGASKFILTARTLLLKTSVDGVSWTSQSNHTAFTNGAHYITNICNIGNNLCAISVESVDTLTSSDGITWSKHSSTVPTALNSIVGTTLSDGTNRMVAVGTNICRYNDSYGATAFSSATIGTGNWSNIIFAQDKFVCISLNSLLLAWSYDGITWTTVATPFQAMSLCYTNNLFIIKGLSQTITSSDLVTFGISQPSEATTSGAQTIYDTVNSKLITANSTSIAYADMVSTNIRLPYVEHDVQGMTNYIKIA